MFVGVCYIICDILIICSGEAYWKGIGTQQDLKRALECFQAASRSGIGQAKLNLGTYMVLLGLYTSLLNFLLPFIFLFPHLCSCLRFPFHFPASFLSFPFSFPLWSPSPHFLSSLRLSFIFSAHQ